MEENEMDVDHSAQEDESSESEAEELEHDADLWARKLGLDDTDGIELTSAFDMYFMQGSKFARTSSNVFSQLVPPLTAEDFHEHITTAKSSQLSTRITILEESHIKYFPAYLAEAASGFNLLFYGFGSKRKLLNSFAKLCAKKGHVVVANAFFPTYTLKDFLDACEQVIGTSELVNTGSGPEAQARRILAKYTQKPRSRHLFLVIHNIESTALRTKRAKACLAALASHPSIHIIASIDHINASLLWSTTELFSRPKAPSTSSTAASVSKLPVSGFRWVWHDLTTLAPYDFELAYVDRTSYAGVCAASQRGAAAAAAAGVSGPVSESAAQHVLASVTQKAKKLFSLLCVRQVAAIDAAVVEGGSTGPVQSSPAVATSYEILFNAARDEFIATNDTAMRTLLGEFRDHGLVLSASSPEGGEALWIPLPKDVLLRLADN